MRLWVIALVVLVVALLIGLVTPGQLGDWVRDAAAWLVEVGRSLARGLQDLVEG